MEKDDILQIIETVLDLEPYTLTEDTHLSDVPQWDSLNILNLQIELTVVQPDADFDGLRECETVRDVLGLVGCV